MIERYDTALPGMSVNITLLVTFTVSFLGASMALELTHLLDERFLGK